MTCVRVWSRIVYNCRYRSNFSTITVISYETLLIIHWCIVIARIGTTLFNKPSVVVPCISLSLCPSFMTAIFGARYCFDWIEISMCELQMYLDLSVVAQPFPQAAWSAHIVRLQLQLLYLHLTNLILPLLLSVTVGLQILLDSLVHFTHIWFVSR